jgi:hypothetical protein
MIELRQAPIDEPQFSLLVIDHNVMRLDIAVHDAFGMAEVEGFEEFEDVVSYVVVDESWVQSPEVGVVDILEDEAGSLTLAISDNIQQSNDVGPTGQVLQDLDLALYFLLLDGFEDLNDTFLIVGDVDALEDFRVFTPT